MSSIHSAQILLVEDDRNLGFVIQDTLKQEGFVVHLASDGKEGLSHFNKGGYDLCLLDVMLPKKDGFSLAEDIRKVDSEVPSTEQGILLEILYNVNDVVPIGTVIARIQTSVDAVC